tara:strand:- start:1285 stop:2202 length:918 start_codon:yes stop_codon:yes gene_type:complete
LSKKIILLAGPTASGKSRLALHLAKKINGEIINADSMQIYKEFSILSSRPKIKEVKKIKHHLYGIISVSKYFSAGDWLKLVKRKINQCYKGKKIPIIVGGTGLYFNTITRGITKIPNIDIKIRNKVRTLFKKLGYKNFYKELIYIDPKAKNTILSTDSQRSQRAYEVFIQTNKSLFDWIKNTKSDFINFEIKKIFLEIPREELLKKISQRTELMFKNNCIKEVENFNKLKLDSSYSASKLIGISEINNYLSGFTSLSQCKQLINVKTRQYAKRQNTWARGQMKNWNKLYSKDFTALLKKTLKVIS